MKTKKSVRKHWAVSEKLEIVQARQSGLTLDEVKSLYGVSATAVSEWLEKYEKGGIAGLEMQPTGGAAHVQSQRVAAAEQLVDGIKSADPDAGVGKVGRIVAARLPEPGARDGEAPAEGQGTRAYPWAKPAQKSPGE